MSKEHDIALRVINTHIDNEDSFQYDALCAEIISEGGILRTSICVTIKMYLESLESIGLIVYNHKTGRYDINKEALSQQCETLK
jgi:hypothetical protein